MGFMDKLRNIFFEDDEDEIEEPVSPKKEKTKEKEEEKSKEKLKEVIARKVELPKRDNKEKKEEKPKEEISTDDVGVKEIHKPIQEEKSEKPKEEIKEVKIKKEPKINQELIFDDEDFILDNKPKVKKETKVVEKVKREESNLYRGKDIKKEFQKDIKTDYSKTTYNSKKEEVKSKTFTPSPIISPIYGILDKNYKKEEVKENKEIRLSSRPSRMDLDSVRNKAFGDLEYDLNLMDDNKKEEHEKPIETEKKTKEDFKKIYNKKDKSDEDKPSIERVTLGEADEYYNDLGLAYNTDYKDLSKDLSDGKVVEKKKDKKDETLEDNLFDLIESMYDKDKDL